MLKRLTEWPLYLEDGEKYLQVSLRAADSSRGVFTPAIIYNVTAMAIEKLLMGFLMYHGTLPENHTMQDLLAAVERVAGPQPQFAESFRYMDSFQEICSMEGYQRREPTWEEIPAILACGRKVRQFIISSGLYGSEQPAASIQGAVGLAPGMSGR